MLFPINVKNSYQGCPEVFLKVFDYICCKTLILIIHLTLKNKFSIISMRQCRQFSETGQNFVLCCPFSVIILLRPRPGSSNSQTKRFLICYYRENQLPLTNAFAHFCQLCKTAPSATAELAGGKSGYVGWHLPFRSCFLA